MSFEGIIKKLSKETAPYTIAVFFTPVSIMERGIMEEAIQSIDNLFVGTTEDRYSSIKLSAANIPPLAIWLDFIKSSPKLKT
ncbi:hypothetical protein KPL37_09150 [Clostridium frigoris]|uniref:Uncharacterized protein n=1 Tax=Clostridium frigoris TaxID=205327 RepID=A0ABS6BSL7_9CLOT|nr:hypothetical protein [Clostridium frigoris]MBU3159918.1 hypothetical protein [Clostridium frigoris]